MSECIHEPSEEEFTIGHLFRKTATYHPCKHCNAKLWVDQGEIIEVNEPKSCQICGEPATIFWYNMPDSGAVCRKHISQRNQR